MYGTMYRFMVIVDYCLSELYTVGLQCFFNQTTSTVSNLSHVIKNTCLTYFLSSLIIAFIWFLARPAGAYVMAQCPSLCRAFH